jgi:heat shock protein HslJ
MACPEGMEEERRFLDALAQVHRYRIRGSHLELLDAKGATQARLEAVALR